MKNGVSFSLGGRGGELLLLIATLIWGLSFIAQVQGMVGVGPFMFVAVRFLLGAIALSCLLFVPFFRQLPGRSLTWTSLLPTAAIGSFLWLGSAFQQVGLQYTSVANASFITSAYIVIVPLAGFFFRSPPLPQHLYGALITMIGVACLSFGDAYIQQEPLRLSWGDLLQFLGAFFWAAQIWCLSYFVGRFNNLHLAIWQSLVCGILSFCAALILEENSVEALIQVWPSLLFAGVVASGIAYGLQVFGQRTVPPGRAVFIFCLEAVFATLAAALFLAQDVSWAQIVGCLVMLIGIYCAQKKVPQ